MYQCSQDIFFLLYVYNIYIYISGRTLAFILLDSGTSKDNVQFTSPPKGLLVQDFFLSL